MTGARDLPVCASHPKLTRDHAEWLADKIGALGDYAKEAAWMLRQWPETAKLQAENDKLRANDARYRFFRDSEWEMFEDRWLSTAMNIYGEGPEQLDAAIDAAIEAAGDDGEAG